MSVPIWIFIPVYLCMVLHAVNEFDYHPVVNFLLALIYPVALVCSILLIIWQNTFQPWMPIIRWNRKIHRINGQVKFYGYQDKRGRQWGLFRIEELGAYTSKAQGRMYYIGKGSWMLGMMSKPLNQKKEVV